MIMRIIITAIVLIIITLLGFKGNGGFENE